MVVRRVAHVNVIVKSCKNVTCLAPLVIQLQQQHVNEMYKNNEYIEGCKLLIRVTAFGQSQESKSFPCIDTIHSIDLSKESFRFEAILLDEEELDEEKLKSKNSFTPNRLPNNTSI